jgi:glycerol-3-phosphate dehydrogenase (NAD(P)+)
VSFERIAVVGAGAWGVALANVAARAGRSVTLVARDEGTAAVIAKSRESPHLPGIRISAHVGVRATLVPDAAAVLLAVPAQALREVTAKLQVAPTTPVVACAKGIEQHTLRFMTDVITETLPRATPAILSGPSFAADVGKGLPTAVTLAAPDPTLAQDLARAIGVPTFRVYHSTDVRGVEIGGAAKNVLAIAAGIVAGKKLGASAAAALVTRGFAELARFGEAFGGRPTTLMGLSGLGDLILTCTSSQSRNYSLGVALGEGVPPQRAGAGKLAEGAFTASALVELASRKGIEMPISAAVAAVLTGELTIDAAIEALLMRPFRAEGRSK